MPLLLRSEEHTSELQSTCNLVCLFCLDRKSTRLNSSHLVISYAVFCLKKKIHIYSFSSSDPPPPLPRCLLPRAFPRSFRSGAQLADLILARQAEGIFFNAVVLGEEFLFSPRADNRV